MTTMWNNVNTQSMGMAVTITKASCFDYECWAIRFNAWPLVKNKILAPSSSLEVHNARLYACSDTEGYANNNYIAREMRNLKLFRIIFKLSSVTDDVRTDSRQATTPRHAKPRHNMYRTVRM
jgi:hypothetical protein